uniref:Uncharacterized protein n=1 Tax=Romanomermis culicivorax TaxID=13658 RepID=A0A915I3T6_ROMCU
MAHLYLPFSTERNGMQSTERNRTQQKFSFRSVQLEAFSAKLQLSFPSETVNDPFRRKRQV